MWLLYICHALINRLAVCFSLLIIYLCKGSIRDDPKIIFGSYVKRAQTISFVERGFERLGLGCRTVVWFGPMNETHSKSFGSFELLLFSLS